MERGIDLSVACIAFGSPIRWQRRAPLDRDLRLGPEPIGLEYVKGLDDCRLERGAAEHPETSRVSVLTLIVVDPIYPRYTESLETVSPSVTDLLRSWSASTARRSNGCRSQRFGHGDEQRLGGESQLRPRLVAEREQLVPHRPGGLTPTESADVGSSRRGLHRKRRRSS